MDFAKAGLAWARQYPAGQLPDRRYMWSASPLIVNTKATLEALPANVRYLTGREAPPVVARTARDGDRDFSQQFAFSLDFWWLYAFYLGLVPAWLALVAGGTFAVATLALGRSAWRMAVSQDDDEVRTC